MKIEKASAAAALGRELMAGELPVVEITLRTTAAEEVIRGLWHEMLDLLVGVGNVLTTDKADRAMPTGARFIKASGFNPKVVDSCIDKGVSLPPGVGSHSEIKMGLEHGFPVLRHAIHAYRWRGCLM